LLFAALLSACSIETKQEPQPQTGTPVTANAPDSLRKELNVPAVVRSTDTVEITLRITNVSGRPIELNLQGRDILFDIVVSNAAGEIVWRRLEGKSAQAILQLYPLAPNQGFQLGDVWRPPGPGLFTVSAEIITDAAPLRFPIHIVRVE
jgi:hypothetical protein